MQDMPKKVTLYSLPPTWGLPTFHPNFLKAYAYCKLAAIDFQNVQTSPSSMADPNFETPVADVSGKIVNGADEIVETLRNDVTDIDQPLQEKQRAQVFAFSSMIEDCLLPAMLHEWYMSDDNWFNVTRPLYTESATFPATVILPWQVKGRMKNKLSVHEDVEALYKRADACYSALSSFLGDQMFFFGSTPTSLDAVVFGHLAPQLYAPMVEARLKKQLRKYQNLCGFVDRIRKGYMSMPRIPPPDPAELEAADAANANPKSAKSQLSTQEKAVRRRTRDFIALGVVVTVAFLLFTNVIDVETADEIQGE
ncbi:hypothetical protein GUITHDRAFT_109736 [Guillardia theta CCMP2712]|uniref:Metaxin n=1 Tax=Guillardia theta (strain CCMP2712) TaxID=905079 RepID=L1J700_GUITC|nr:hypothetical protein GUITHDRAFT_109736 [Guillardia theta CCMP2712]EKX44281.1 hypothetical protein GUITHDRAFT_109736 [Guillardia theta CCMP2712]|eukprot:XP_005831261.1 hypothetical protein GUITHDRAFT_109736 [Guillardia theta CCMP2712]